MRGYATVQDIVIARDKLTDADLLRLRKAAFHYMGGTQYRDPKELVADAIRTGYCAAAGDGGRRWPLKVPFMAYLINTIRGIASDDRGHQQQHPTVTGFFGPDDPLPPPTAVDPCALHTPSPEDWWEQAQEHQMCEEWFATVLRHFQEEEDEDVLWLIRGRMEGLNARQIIERSGMTVARHASALKRWSRYCKRNRP